MHYSSDDVAHDEWNQRVIGQRRPPDDWHGSRCPYCDSDDGWYRVERYRVRGSWEEEPEVDYDWYYKEEKYEDLFQYVYSRCGYCNRADAKRDGMIPILSHRLWEWCHEEGAQ
jgi:hypothetical protein